MTIRLGWKQSSENNHLKAYMTIRSLRTDAEQQPEFNTIRVTTYHMEIQQRILTFVIRSNWILLITTNLVGFLGTPRDFALGILFGGLIVTVNFHLLARTLRKALTPPHLSPVSNVLAKYYIRFVMSGIIIFILISQQLVNPLGLFIGLSVVVASIMLATMRELKNLIFKEAV